MSRNEEVKRNDRGWIINARFATDDELSAIEKM